VAVNVDHGQVLGSIMVLVALATLSSQAGSWPRGPPGEPPAYVPAAEV